MKASGIFVTATGTEVGKTVLSCALARLLSEKGRRFRVRKLFASGALRQGKQWVSEDALLLKEASRSEESLEQINPFCFRAPLAPEAAARLEGKAILWSSVVRAAESVKRSKDFLVVEGVGGLRVPLGGGRDVADLIRLFQLPSVVVASAKLGTINHTLLTLEALRREKLPCLGVVLNRFSPRSLTDRTNLDFFRRNRVPVLACLPDDPRLARDSGRLSRKLASTPLGRWLLENSQPR
jgi:dethiobiotin synthetase